MSKINKLAKEMLLLANKENISMFSDNNDTHIIYIHTLNKTQKRLLKEAKKK